MNLTAIRLSQKRQQNDAAAVLSTQISGAMNGPYLLLRLDAFSGLIFVLALLDSTARWVARLQLPFFHLMEGSGQAVQYHPEESSVPRLQPLHCSTIWLQIPPL
jgi:hypothetical protein